ncbi:MAG: nitrogen regulation protein NR(II) [Gammaproteobacteria bacterium]
MPAEKFSDHKARLVLEAQSSGILWLDASLNVRYINPAAKDLFEIGFEHVTTDSAAGLLQGNVTLSRAMQRVKQSGETITLRELVLKAGTGMGQSSLTVDCTVSALALASEDPGLLLEFTALDRHLRIRRESSLGTRHQLNRDFASRLAHELKNPFGSIRGAAQLLERKLPTPGLADYTRLIVNETDRLTALVDALLGPWQPAESHVLNVHEAVDHVIGLTQAAASGVTVVRDYDPSLPELVANRDQLVQALLNLAKNAREAAGASGRLVFRTRVLRQFTLKARRYRLAACIDLEDNGPGISPEAEAHLFTPLVSRKPGGSGLGLSIAQELVSRNGGLIEYRSAPGCTVFSLILPVEPERERVCA